jgi:hypothetical protein
MFALTRSLNKRLICALLVWIVLWAQWGAVGHVLQHLGALSQAATSAPAAVTALSLEAKQNPSGDTAAATHSVCSWCLSAAQVLGAAVLNSTLRPFICDLLMGLKPVKKSVLTVIQAFTAYRSRAPPVHKLM